MRRKKAKRTNNPAKRKKIRRRNREFFSQNGYILSCQTRTQGIKLDKWGNPPFDAVRPSFRKVENATAHAAEDTDNHYGGRQTWHFSLKRQLTM
jgi:hypothetical protein